MPYGIPLEHGGDSPENTAKMERCIKSVLSKNRNLKEENAIRICKVTLFPKKAGT